MNSVALRYGLRRAISQSTVAAHDSQFAAGVLHEQYSALILKRELHNRMQGDIKESGNGSINTGNNFKEGDVVNEVKESLRKQAEADANAWKADCELSKGVKSKERAAVGTKSAESASVDDSFEKTVDKMMQGENVSPFMKKILEKEKSRAQSASKDSKEVKSKPSESTINKEAEDLLVDDQTLVQKTNEAINELETGIENKSLPLFVRPMAKSLIKNLKAIRTKAETRLEEMGIKTSVAPAQSVSSQSKVAEEVISKGTKAAKAEGVKAEGVKPEGVKPEGVKPEGVKKENTTKNGKETDETMSEFMETLKKNFTGDGKSIPSFITYSVGSLLVLAFLLSAAKGKSNRSDITYDEFVKELLLRGHVKEITLSESGRVYVEVIDDFEGTNGKSYSNRRGGEPALYSFDVPDVSAFMKNVEEMQLELGLSRQNFVPMSYRTTPVNLSVSNIIMLMSRGKGGMNMMSKVMGMEPKTIEIVKKTGVTFKDVAGIDEAKGEIMEFIDFLKNGDKYASLGAKLPKGAILTGPPGTGKTLLVKAAAGEANVPFISISGSDFVELFVGMGAKRVRELFAEARKNAPCIVFIDEIDAIGKKRNEGKFSGSNDEREQTLNQILIEMDGFKPRDGITIFAGTNRVDVLDPALLRAGRFDRHIAIDKPDIRGRKAIAIIYLGKIKLDGELEDMAQKLAEMTPGYTGADICNICNEAAIIAIRNEHESVQLIDIIGAVDRVLCGMEKKNSVMSLAEKRRIAYHESGHAIVGWYSEHVDPMLKVTIVPRSNGALGFTQNLPKEIPLYSEEEMGEMLVQLMGGRAAEQIFCGNMTTGASDDLNKATKLAYGMVAGYGFNDVVGPINYQQEDESFQKPYSEATGQLIDSEARRILKDSMEKASAMLEINREKMQAVAELLLERETITSVDMENICGKRKGRSPTNYSEIIRNVDLSVKEKKKQADDKREEKERAETASAAAAEEIKNEKEVI